MKIKRLFRFYNRALFNNALIEPRIKFWKHKHFFGWFSGYEEEGFLFCTIKLNKKEKLTTTLLHEMVHLYQFQFNHKVNHKRSFKAWYRKIKRETGLDIR